MEKSKKELLKLPQRDWEKITQYDSILIVPSGSKHDSGYMMIAIIGMVGNEPKEICGYPDDISWDYTDYKQAYECTGVRTDCYYPQGILHFWARDTSFQVGESLSSITIKVINNPPTQL